MSTMEYTPQEQQNQRRSIIISVVVHILVLLLALFPFLQYPDPPPGQEGVLISFGLPDQGEGEDRPDVQQDEPTQQPPAASAPAILEAPKPTPAKEPVVTADDAEVRLRRERQEAERLNQLKEQQRVAQENARAVAEAEARRKAAEEEAREKAEREQARKQYGDFFGGQGKGQNNKAGNQGDPKGDPDASKLDGVTKGTGMIGDGLSNRGVRKAPSLVDRSQKTGRVVIYVCVDRKGNVTKADYTMRNSTTSDAELINLARRNAMNYQFSESDLDEQCGTITYEFKVQ